MVSRSHRIALAGVGLVAIAAAVTLYALAPAWSAVVPLVLLGPQLLLATRWRAGNRLLALARAEAAVLTPLQQAIRGLLLVPAVAELGTGPAIGAAAFYVVLLAGTGLVPYVTARTVEPRVLVAALPPAQQAQDAHRLADPGSVPGRATRARIRRAAATLEVVVIVAVLLAAGTDAGVALWVSVAAAVLAGGSLLVEATTLVTGLARRTPARFEDLVTRSLDAAAPQFLVHFSAPTDSVYQVRQWLPYLAEVGRPFAVVVREPGLLAPVSALVPHVPVVCAPRLTQLNRTVVPSVRAAFYVNHAMRNAHLLRHTRLTHVQLLHGESDKSPSVSKFSRAFDELYVAGQAAVDRYATHGVDVPAASFRIVGRPQADAVTTQCPERPTVLYAPTWEGWDPATDDSSVGLLGVALVERLLARGDVRVVVRLHPNTGIARRGLRRNAAALRDLVERSPGDHVWSEPGGALSLVDCFNDCTVLVSDISSVMADFLRSEKPMVVTDVAGIGTDAVRAQYPTAAASWILRRDAGDLDAILDDALGPDTLRDARRLTREYVLGAFEGPAEPVFAGAVTTTLDSAGDVAAR